MLKARGAESSLLVTLAALEASLKEEFDGLPTPTPPELPLTFDAVEQSTRELDFMKAYPKLAPAVTAMLEQLKEMALVTLFDEPGAIGLWSGNRRVGVVARRTKSDLVILIDPGSRPVSFVLGQVPVNKENQFEVRIPAKGDPKEAIALALGLLKQVV